METLKAIQTRNSVAHLSEPAPSIEEMEEVYQHAELTMGWCVECHRETEVDMADNNYYTHLHEQLKDKYGGEKFTVDQIGGLECAKCHY